MVQADLLKLQVIAKELHGSDLDRGAFRFFSWVAQYSAVVLGLTFAVFAVWLPFSVIPALLSNPPSTVAVHDVQMVVVAISGLTLVGAVLFFIFALMVGRARQRRSRTHDLYGRILALKWNVRHLNPQPLAAE